MAHLIFIQKYFLYLRLNFNIIIINMNRIKEILNEKGIKQTWLAEKLGKSFKIVNAYACNRQQPPIETLYRIAEILQVSVKDLLTEDKDKK
jgi:transcriptional regulator with XRE-family HTH domain